MEVGILSMQEVVNYGSFLQAYGLKSILQNQGHEVSFINIRPGEQLGEYKISKFHKPILLLKRLMVKHPLRQLRTILTLHRRFNQEFKPELGVLPHFDSSHKDAVVIGSDEVFNFAQTTWFGFSPQLFGEGLNTDKVISYAGCFGATTLEKIEKLGLTERMKTLLNNFSAISVRDDNSAHVVKSLTGKSPERNVDPVLAYSFEKEIVMPAIDKKYMIVYTYPGRIKSKDEVEAIVNFARKKGLKLISNAHYFDWVDEVIHPHPFELLGYMKQAEYIVTDTFHGAVMSIKYNRPFACIVRGMNSNKLSSLLNQFGLNDRKVEQIKNLASTLETKIAYDTINKSIADEQNRTSDYLKKMLS